MNQEMLTVMVLHQHHQNPCTTALIWLWLLLSYNYYPIIYPCLNLLSKTQFRRPPEVYQVLVWRIWTNFLCQPMHLTMNFMSLIFFLDHAYWDVFPANMMEMMKQNTWVVSSASINYFCQTTGADCVNSTSFNKQVQKRTDENDSIPDTYSVWQNLHREVHILSPLPPVCVQP